MVRLGGRSAGSGTADGEVYNMAALGPQVMSGAGGPGVLHEDLDGPGVPVVQLFPLGYTSGVRGSNGGVVGRRQASKGWTWAATRGLRAFVFSIVPGGLGGEHVVRMALTRTLGACPASAREFARVEEGFWRKVERRGLVRSLTVHEWHVGQSAYSKALGLGPRPHSHDYLDVDARRMLPDPESYPGKVTDDVRQCVGAMLIELWLRAAGRYGPRRAAQWFEPVYDSAGWFNYSITHAGKGPADRQRSTANAPPEWEAKGYGKMWRHRGEWPREEPARLVLSLGAFHVVRRRHRRMLREFARERLRKAQASLAWLRGHGGSPRALRRAEGREKAARRALVRARRGHKRPARLVRGVSRVTGERVCEPVRESTVSMPGDSSKAVPPHGRRLSAVMGVSGLRDVGSDRELFAGVVDYSTGWVVDHVDGEAIVW